MRWVIGALGGLFLLLFGSALRRLLHLQGAGVARSCGWVRLTAERESIYQSVALEIETQASILGVSLNDAVEERDLGKQEIAWRLVGLADCEWERLAQIANGLLNALGKYMPAARVVVPVRNIAAHHFKSPAMVDYARMHEVLDQFVFRYKLRFQLHMRVLRRAMETLTLEFGQTYRSVLRTGASSNRIWNHLDLCFHDFDLITKEVLLAFRTLLACLPDEELEALATDLNALVVRGVRTAPLAVVRMSSSR
jgi:hypothetical protein